MKLSEFRKVSNDYTSKASEITRQLSLAGIAIIWLFKNPDRDENLLHPNLKCSLLLLSFALFFDLVQYIAGGITWIVFFRKQEKKYIDDTSDPEIKAPTTMSIPIYIFYALKIILMLISYILIFLYLMKKL
jgi:amino acid transporter